MPTEWYVSFHGGSSGHEFNNIHVYSKEGVALRKALDKRSIDPAVILKELRDFELGPDGNLYVANAHRGYSQILRFKGAPNVTGRHEYMDVFVEHHIHKNPGLLHPFKVSFSSSGDLYISSQDTNLVTRYHGPQSTLGSPGKPMDLPDHLRSSPFPGAFIASSKMMENGLGEVRSVVFGNDGALYVADPHARHIKVFHGETGLYQGALGRDVLKKPIHLLLDGQKEQMYVTDREANTIFIIDLASGETREWVDASKSGLHGPGGMAMEGGHLYVANREGKQIIRYPTEGGHPHPEIFIDDLPDNPEFIKAIRIP